MVLSIRLNGKVSSGVGNKLKLENQTYGDFYRLVCDSILIFFASFRKQKSKYKFFVAGGRRTVFSWRDNNSEQLCFWTAAAAWWRVI